MDEKGLLKLTVIERYVNLAIIAQGILSYLAIMKTQWVWAVHKGSSWLRTYSSVLPSDENSTEDSAIVLFDGIFPGSR